MELLLERTEIIALPEKEEILKELKVYDPLWEDHPKVKKIRAESRTEGEIRASQRMLVNIVKARFPALAELAQQEVTQINNPDVLDFLAQKISIAPDESMVRWLLSSPAA